MGLIIELGALKAGSGCVISYHSHALIAFLSNPLKPFSPISIPPNYLHPYQYTSGCVFTQQYSINFDRKHIFYNLAAMLQHKRESYKYFWHQRNEKALNKVWIANKEPNWNSSPHFPQHWPINHICTLCRDPLPDSQLAQTRGTTPAGPTEQSSPLNIRWLLGFGKSHTKSPRPIWHGRAGLCQQHS